MSLVVPMAVAHSPTLRAWEVTLWVFEYFVLELTITVSGLVLGTVVVVGTEVLAVGWPKPAKLMP